MGTHASYSPGFNSTEAVANMNDGYIVVGTGAPQLVAPVGNADTITVHNYSGEYVRGVITPNPVFAATTTGNLSFLVAPGAAFQESFSRDIIAAVTFDAVTLPIGPISMPVNTMVAAGTPFELAVKFVES